MTATKVGIREFRAGLADYVDADARVAVSRHGQTVGYLIPGQEGPRSADVATLKAAGEKNDALLRLEESEVDAAVEDFKQVRREAKKKA